MRRLIDWCAPRRSEGLFIGTALVLLICWGGTQARSWVLIDAEASGAASPYAECGEVLIHGFVPARSPCPSLYMPLASIVAARLFDHSGPRQWPWREAAVLAGLWGLINLRRHGQLGLSASVAAKPVAA